MASFQRKFFRKFLKLRCFIWVGGRTSLKDADANCTWLNKNRIAEEMGGKIFSYQQKSLLCKAGDFAEKQNDKIKIRREKKEIKDV